MSNYQLKIADLYNIPIDNVKKIVDNFLNKEKYVLHCENLHIYMRLGLKLKKIHLILEFNQSQWLKPYVEFNTLERIEAEKNGVKDEKAFYKSVNKAVNSKAMDNLRNTIDVKLVSNKKDYLKWTSKRRYMSKKYI